jgi:hypothetical protein
MVSTYTSNISFIKQLFALNTETTILNDPSISGMANPGTVEMKQIRMAATLFQMKVYSWDTNIMSTAGVVAGVAPYMTALEVFNKFKIDRTGPINGPAYKSYIDIFARGVKIFNAETEVP